tara:strand:- start:163 stop:345 length:183 start_codon:yes stop_codon:yes gene_type:complete
MIEFESINNNPEIVIKTILWIFTPIVCFVAAELFLREIDDDDDDDFGGGTAIPAYLPTGA